MIKKTIIVWERFDEFPQYIVLDGDYSRFHELLIGAYYEDEVQLHDVDVMHDMLFDEYGNPKVYFLPSFPISVIKELGDDEVVVIHAGIIP